jgi:hypothetical protein
VEKCNPMRIINPATRWRAKPQRKKKPDAVKLEVIEETFVSNSFQVPAGSSRQTKAP